MNDLETLQKLNGKKGSIGAPLPGLLFDRFDWERESGKFTVIAADASDLRSLPFSVVYERLLAQLLQEGFLILGENSPPGRLAPETVIFAQRFCQRRCFEFLTMSFEGRYSYFILRKIAEPGKLTDPNTLRPLRYVLVDHVYGFFLKFPRLKTFLKSAIKTMLFRKN